MLRLQARLPDRYTTADPDQLREWIRDAKAALGSRLVILGHHYQRDEVIECADARGDSFSSPASPPTRGGEDIVFCGVHFMAESADILTGDHQQVILPNLSAGCSMADMADLDQVEEAWAELATVTDVERIVPITYMNSSAAIKAFVGRARRGRLHVLERPGDLRVGAGRGDKVLFFPDQHLGRNTTIPMGHDGRRCGSGTPAWTSAASRTATSGGHFLLWRASARCTSASAPSTSRRSGPSTPT